MVETLIAYFTDDRVWSAYLVAFLLALLAIVLNALLTAKIAVRDLRVTGMHDAAYIEALESRLGGRVSKPWRVEGYEVPTGSVVTDVEAETEQFHEEASE